MKFSVRSQTFSGGASIHIKWTDGPRTKDVEAVADQYEGGLVTARYDKDAPWNEGSR